MIELWLFYRLFKASDFAGLLRAYLSSYNIEISREL
jgi:hypothetical protein